MRDLPPSREALQVTWLGLGVNLLLAVLKAIGGIVANSAAMISDAGHSLSDLLSDIVTLWAITSSRAPQDHDHPYGHGRFETLGALIVALILIGTGMSVAYHGLFQIDSRVIPGKLAIWMAVLSIIIKEALYQYSFRVGRGQKNRLLLANAWHHRTDAISSVVALIGVGGAILGYPIMDPIAGILVSGWIIKAGITIGYDAIKELADIGIEKEFLLSIKHLLDNTEGVLRYHKVRARRMGPQVLIDLHIEVPEKQSVSASHQIAERVRRKILNEIPQVNEVLVHVDAEDDINEEKYDLMRPHSKIEDDIKQVASNRADVKGISDIQCHYLNGALSVHFSIVVDPDIHVYEARKIARALKMGVEKIRDVSHAEIHLDLR